MDKPKIGILLSSTREGRFGDKPAAWIRGIAEKRTDIDVELLDLRDYPMPFFEEARALAYAPPKNPIALRWGAKLAEIDGFIVVAAEYNHGPTGVLKNALDYAYAEYKRKPMGFVGYGGVGAARAVEQLRLIAIELDMVPTRTGVHLGMAEMMGLMMQGKTFDDFPYLAKYADTLVDEVTWWAKLLKKARAEQA